MGNQGAYPAAQQQLPQPSAGRERRAKQLIDAIDPSGGFTEQQALELWRAYDTTGSGRLRRSEALKFFKAIVSRMKVLGQVPQNVDDNALAEQLLSAMDSDGDGFIAWTEWSQMTDGQWKAVMGCAREAFAQPGQGTNPYPPLPGHGGAAHRAGTRPTGQSTPMPPPRPQNLRYPAAAAAAATASSTHDPTNGLASGFILPPVPNEIRLSGYACDEEIRILQSSNSN